jgi:three-Cys-motif partner protein
MFEFPEPKDDGLFIPDVAEHYKYKHHFVSHYIHAFTTSMKNKDWSGLHYIDLFAGAGMYRLRNSQQLEWGSPMLAAHTKNPFTRLHLCEADPEKFKALDARIETIRPDSQILLGDANKEISKIAQKIPDDSLSLCFLDPYGLHFELERLKVFANKRMDLIVFFPDRLDALRNWAAYYLDNPESNLDRCLGSGSDWRSRLHETPADRHAEEFRNMYIDQIKRHLAYTHFDFERISTTRGQPLYYLIFCARHQFAEELWRKVVRIKPDGQRTFLFD